MYSNIVFEAAKSREKIIHQANIDFINAIKSYMSINQDSNQLHKKEINSHTEHCCIYHGCKYGNNDCPVETEKLIQSYICESCEELCQTHENNMSD